MGPLSKQDINGRCAVVESESQNQGLKELIHACTQKSPSQERMAPHSTHVERTHRTQRSLPADEPVLRLGRGHYHRHKRDNTNHDMNIAHRLGHPHSPFRATAVGATNPEASETRHRATSTTNALKAMVIDVKFGLEKGDKKRG